MVTEVQKYRAQFFQVSGFCLMSPFGKLILEFLDIKLNDLNLRFIFYLACTVLLAFTGIIMILQGLDTVEKK